MGVDQARLLLADYERAKSILLDYVGKRKDVLAIWQYGEISQPGISDLDLMAVVKEKCDPGIAEYLRKDKFDPILKKAMAHANLIIVPETTAQGVLYWDDMKIKNAKDGTRIDDPEDLNLSFRRLAMLVDWIFERAYRIFSIRRNGIPNQQLGLGLMKSFGYCVDNYRIVNPNADIEGYDELKDRITSLRNQWFCFGDSEKGQQISKLIEDFYDFVIQCHRDAFEFLSESDFYPYDNVPDKDYVLTFPDGLQFSFEKSYVQREDNIIVLPKKLLNHFSLYASTGSALSNFLQNSFNETPPCTDRFIGEYKSFLQKRMHVASHWYDCLRANGFTYGLFKFGWYL